MIETRLTRDLNAFSAEFKHRAKKPIGLPLKWILDDYGDLWLDNINLCRGAAIQPKEWSFEENRMILTTNFGSIEVVIEWPVEEIALITEIVTHKKLFWF